MGLCGCGHGNDPGSDDAGIADVPADVPSPPLTFVAVTFNTGTTENKAWASDTDRYTPQLGKWSDEWYGDGLAWTPAVEAARTFFADVDPDVVAFQEIFWTGECPEIPANAKTGFACESWNPGDPTVAQVILGEGWQVACHPGKSDKCAAVNRRFGTFRDCDADFCLEGLKGYEVEDCGKGARIARGIIDLEDGGTLTLVSVHGTSGLSADDQDCRTRQFEQVFDDLGDGEPGANGDINLIMGDWNTDPGRMAEVDPSAAYLYDHVGEGTPFHFLTEVGPDVTPTYGGLISIDHVISDTLTGDCRAIGVTDGSPPVLEDFYFDHAPVVCSLTE